MPSRRCVLYSRIQLYAQQEGVGNEDAGKACDGIQWDTAVPFCICNLKGRPMHKIAKIADEYTHQRALVVVAHRLQLKLALQLCPELVGWLQVLPP